MAVSFNNNQFFLIILILIIIFGFLIYFVLNNKCNSENTKEKYLSSILDSLNKKKTDDSQNLPTQYKTDSNIIHPLKMEEVSIMTPQTTTVIPRNPPPLPDPVRVYDTHNLDDMFAYPTARPASYIFRPMLGNPAFNIPTRGFPDAPTYVGNLVECKLLHNNKFDTCHNCNPPNINKCGNPNCNCINCNCVNCTCNDFSETRFDDRSILQLMAQQKYPRSDKYYYYVLLSANRNPPIKIKVHTKNNDELYDGDEVVIPELGNKKYIFRKNKSAFDYNAWY